MHARQNPARFLVTPLFTLLLLGGLFCLTAQARSTTAAVGKTTAAGHELAQAASLLTAVTVDTTSSVIDGNTSSISALLANRGPDGKISFREALTAINNTGAGNTINFNLPHGSLISYGSTLELKVSYTTIDGDVDGDTAPDVVLDGPGQNYNYTLAILTDNNTIRNLAFTAIVLYGAASHDNLITHCFVGTDVDGKVARFNEGNGVGIQAGAHHNTVEYNIIAGNGWSDPNWYGAGVRIYDGAHDNQVRANRMGINIEGKSLPNEGGVYIHGGAYQNVIGGGRSSLACDAPCNVISNSSDDAGVSIWQSGTISNVVKGNYIGMDQTGAFAQPNAWGGVYVGDGASGNTIGGVRASADCAGPCNVVSGNLNDGIWLYGANTNSNTVQGNYIGVNPQGTKAFANTLAGIRVNGSASQNTIGGLRASTECEGACNVISGNSGSGVLLRSAGTISNVVQGNYIGVSPQVTKTIANGSSGVEVQTSASRNTVGGRRASADCSGPCNVIGGNGLNGVYVHDTGTFSNVVQGNFIGIDSEGAELRPNLGSGILLDGFSTLQSTSSDPARSVSSREARVADAYQQEGEPAALFAPAFASPGAVQAGEGPMGTLIGGTGVGEGNVIGGNGACGIRLQGPGVKGTQVQGNAIGTDELSNNLQLSNDEFGVLILNTSDNQVGPDNLISHNEWGGVAIRSDPDLSPTDPTRHNAVRNNTIRDNNKGLGIDLQPKPEIGVSPDGSNEGRPAPALFARRPADDPQVWDGVVDAPDGSDVDLFAGADQVFVGTAKVMQERFEVHVSPDLVPLPSPVLATVTDPFSNTSEFSMGGELTLVATNALPGGRVYAFGVLTDTWKNQTITDPTKKVTVTVGTQEFALNNSGAEGDLFANDLYFSGWFTAPVATGPYSVALSMNRVGVTAVPLRVIDDPELVVLSDLQELKNEFARTSGDDGPELYRALKRMAQYTEEHTGVFIDARQQIKQTSPTDPKPYADYNYASSPLDRLNMGSAIDNYIQTLEPYFVPYFFTLRHRYLAIIGDDAVIPFIRRTDPLYDASNCAVPGSDQPGSKRCSERAYPSPYEVGPPAGNATLADSALPKIMTDVPYASIESSLPDTQNMPSPDMGVGRIFFKTPRELKEAFDAYETPLRLDPSGSGDIAAGLHLANEPGIAWEDIFSQVIVPPITSIFSPTINAVSPSQIITGFVPGAFYRFNGVAKSPWITETVQDAINYAALTVLDSHANQFFNTTPISHTLFYAYPDLGGMPQQPGHLLINEGCHSGYSVSRAADAGKQNLYENAWPTIALDRRVTYLAPTVYGYGEMAGTPVQPQYHSRLMNLFLEALRTEATVGTAFEHAQADYTVDRSAEWDKWDTYTRYGIELYALPTQPIQRTAGATLAVMPAARGPSASQVSRPETSHTLDVVVDTPNFQVVTNPDGSVRFEVPNAGFLNGSAHYPLLPESVRTYRLPPGATLTSIGLTAEAISYPDPVTLETMTPVNYTWGPQPGRETLTGTYPSEIYHYTTETANDGMLLHVTVNPLQYDPDTLLVTLYTHVELQVAYDAPASPTSFAGLQVNNGNPVDVGQVSLPLRATIDSSQTQTLRLTWRIADAADTTLRSGQVDVDLVAGINTVDLNTDTLGWHPGPMLLTATLGDGVTIMDNAATLFTARGRSLAVTTDRIFYNTETTATVSVSVYDEAGAGVTSLAGSLAAALDGAPFGLTFTPLEVGRYQATLSLGGLAAARHELVISLPGTGSAATGFSIDRSPLASPAVSIRRTSEGLELRWTETQAFVVRYEVHRSTSPYFTPGEASRLADISALYVGREVIYVDQHAFDLPLNNYFYTVLAVGNIEAKSPVSSRVGAYNYTLVPGIP